MTRRKRHAVDQADRQPRDDAGQAKRPRTLFVPRDLDDAGLTADEFRVYAAMHRRAGDDGVCHESVPRMAARIGLSERQVHYARRALERYRLIRCAEVRPGQPTVYRMTPPSAWRLPAPRIVDGDATTEPTPDADVRGTPAPHAGVSANGETDTRSSPVGDREVVDAAPAPISETAVPDALDVPTGTEDAKRTPAPHAGVPLHHMQGTPAPCADKGTPRKVPPGEGPPLPTRSYRQHELSAADAATRATPKAVVRDSEHNRKPKPQGQASMKAASAHLPVIGAPGDRGEVGARPAGSGKGNGPAARPSRRFDAPLPPEELARLAQSDPRHILRHLQA